MIQFLKQLFGRTPEQKALKAEQKEMIRRIDEVLRAYTDKHCNYTSSTIVSNPFGGKPMVYISPAEKINLLAAICRPKWELIGICRRGRPTTAKFYKDGRRSIAMIDEALGIGQVVSTLSEGKLAVKLEWYPEDSSVELIFSRLEGATV